MCSTKDAKTPKNMQEYGRISQGWKRQARTPLFVGFGGKGGRIGN